MKPPPSPPPSPPPMSRTHSHTTKNTKGIVSKSSSRCSSECTHYKWELQVHFHLHLHPYRPVRLEQMMIASWIPASAATLSIRHGLANRHALCARPSHGLSSMCGRCSSHALLFQTFRRLSAASETLSHVTLSHATLAAQVPTTMLTADKCTRAEIGWDNALCCVDARVVFEPFKAPLPFAHHLRGSPEGPLASPQCRFKSIAPSAAQSRECPASRVP